MLPPIDRDPFILHAHSTGRFHYIQDDPRFPDGWYYDHKMWLGDYEPKECVRYGPIPYEMLETFVREHESELHHTVEAVLSYLRRKPMTDTSPKFDWLKSDTTNMLDLMVQPLSPYQIVRADPASLAQLVTMINRQLKAQRPHLLEFGWAVVFDKLQTSDWLAYIADVMSLYERVPATD